LAEKNRELAARVVEIECMKERLSGTVESITDAVFLVDETGAVELANCAAKDFLWPAGHRQETAVSVPEVADLLRDQVSTQDQEIVLHRADGDKNVLVSVIPMRGDSGGTLQGNSTRVVAVKDVTEHRQLQERVAREGRMSALGKVAASVAHEIRNPLNAIEGFARLLEQDLADTPSERLRNALPNIASYSCLEIADLLSAVRSVLAST